MLLHGLNRCDKISVKKAKGKCTMAYRIDTQCIHGENGYHDHSYGAIPVPIYQTATYAHPGIGRSTGYDYTRESNPTRTELERTMTALERAVDTVACTTGMAAIDLCLELFQNGDHIVCSEDLYGGSVRLFQTLGAQRGITFTYVDTSDVAQTAASIRENTKALYIETPSNPTMKVTDFAEMKQLADKYKLLIIADNTFLSPYLQNPLELGADLVLHSGTKYLGGHNDTLAGFLSTNDKELAVKIRYMYKTLGCCLSPFDSYLVLRGIKTLAIRMEKQQENAMKLAKWLETQEKVEQVFYVGLPEHPGYEVNKKQARGAGGMLSFRVDSEETARHILGSVKLIQYAESLGGVESLITYPMLQTHGDLPKEVREHLGITETFLRFSAGIENADDLIADLAQALA